jgi:ABC-2 type transport system ATP-binding protein
MQIKIEEIVIRRGRTNAVNGLNCAFAGPGWFGIMGANGSGKTSLLRAIAGRLPIASGKICFNLVDVSLSRAIRAMSVGFAVDPLMLPSDLSPRELFAIIRRTQDYSGADPGLNELWGALGVTELLDRKIGTLSSGNRQRISIYAAFIGFSNGCVILDEPFNWLDPLSAFDTKQALKTLAVQGYTIITALHDLATLAANCDSGIMLSDGTVVKELDAESLLIGRRNLPAFEMQMIDHLRQQQA